MFVLTHATPNPTDFSKPINQPTNQTTRQQEEEQPDATQSAAANDDARSVGSSHSHASSAHTALSSLSLNHHTRHGGGGVGGAALLPAPALVLTGEGLGAMDDRMWRVVLRHREIGACPCVCLCVYVWGVCVGGGRATCCAVCGVM